MPQGVCRVNMAQKRSACTVSGPRIARADEPFSVSCQPLISPQVGYPPLRIVLQGPSSYALL